MTDATARRGATPAQVPEGSAAILDFPARARPAPSRYVPISARHRFMSLCLSVLLPALMLIPLLLRFEGVMRTPAPTPLVVNMLPLASPPEPAREGKPGPLQTARKQTPPQPQDTPIPPPRMVTPLHIPVSAAPPMPPAPDPGPPAPATTAPVSNPAPPAPQISGRDTSYEAQLLAHIQKFRRYPSAARRMGDQGVAHLRVRIDRGGHVLSAQVLRGSGFGSLDKGALETIRRADPLPAVPADRNAPFEMVLPVEFYIE
ncbi:energy transducer TonB [Sphingomonas sp. CJ20]